MIRFAAAVVLAVMFVGSVIASDMEKCLENNSKDVCASALMR